MNPEKYLIFIFATTLWLASPGPTVMLSIKNGIKYGEKYAFIGILGNIMAFLIMLIISTIGVGSVILLSNTSLIILKYLAALYLVYLGFKFWGSDYFNQESLKEKTIMQSSYELFTEAFFTTITNPKGFLYISALLPQFITFQEDLWPQILILSLTTAFLQIVVFMSYAGFASRAGDWFKKPKNQKIFNKVTSLILVGFGFTLVFS